MKQVDDSSLLNIGKELLHEEGRVLELASQELDHNYVKAVRLLASIKGKVIVSGLGKSGHVARKIAATFSSTGTSSCFLHAAEALHGDLGMIGEQDALIAIAFGGETEEVLKVARFARRIDVPVIAISGNPRSSLGSLADILLEVRIREEACPLRLAPTSSTILTMAMGDALAAGLMLIHGFKKEEFASYHPGGKLGRQLLLVNELMHDMSELNPVVLTDDFHAVLEKVTSKNFGIAPVVDSCGVLLGSITDGDLRRGLIKFESRVFQMKVEELMSGSPKVICGDVLCLKALKMMQDNHITSLFVVDDNSTGKLRGIIRLHDLLAAKIV